MRDIKKQIEQLKSTDEEAIVFNNYVEVFDNLYEGKIHAVHHERDDEEDNGFSQYSYIDTNIKCYN